MGLLNGIVAGVFSSGVYLLSFTLLDRAEPEEQRLTLILVLAGNAVAGALVSLVCLSFAYLDWGIGDSRRRARRAVAWLVTFTAAWMLAAWAVFWWAIPAVLEAAGEPATLWTQTVESQSSAYPGLVTTALLAGFFVAFLGSDAPGLRLLVLDLTAPEPVRTPWSWLPRLLRAPEPPTPGMAAIVTGSGSSLCAIAAGWAGFSPPGVALAVAAAGLLALSKLLGR